jgi:hypothetical protein
MPAQFKAPYGDIVYVQTPTLDALSKQLYAEQKQRQMIQYQENKALDEGMRKEFANVRSVDTPEVIGAYNQYKTLKKQLYFDKSLKKDPLAFNQKQQEANAALQKTYEIINGSGEIKDMSKSLLGEKIKNPDVMADDSGQRLATLNNTPYSQVKNHPQYGDLTNPDTYRYQGSNTDFGKLVSDAAAAGGKKEVLGKSVPIDNGYQTQTPVYQAGNTESEVYNHLLNSGAIHRTGRDASYLMDKVPAVQIENTIEKYKQIPQDKRDKMGSKYDENLIHLTDNKADNFYKYLAMNYAINSEPKEGEPIIKENKSMTMAAQEAKDRRMAALHHGYSEAEIRLRDALKNNGEDEQNGIVDARYDEVKQDALKNPQTYKPIKGEPYSQYSIKVTDPIRKMFAVKDANGKDIYPDDVRYSKDLKYVIPVFYQHYVTADKDGHPIKDKQGRETRLPQPIMDEKGAAAVDPTLSKPILESEFKERWKKELLGVSGYNKSLKGAKSSTGTGYKIDGKPYSHKQLNDMGYDDNEIDQAIKVGIISK